MGHRKGLGLGGMGLAAAGFAMALPAPAQAALPDLLAAQSGQIVVLSALAAGGVALALAGGLWALAEQRIARRRRRARKRNGARTKAAVGERAAAAAPLILPVRFICLVLAWKRRAMKKAEWPAMRMSILGPRAFVGLRISDIVKRKRIRSRAGWGEA